MKGLKGWSLEPFGGGFEPLGKELEAFMKILELLGFAIEDNGNGTLSVKIGENEWTMKIDNNLKDPITGLSAWGLTDHDTKTISINFTSGKLGDVTLTILHEVCHAVLGPWDQDIQHDFIYSVEHSYMVALRALGVEFSAGGIQDNKLLPNFVLHIKAQASIHDPHGYHRVPPLEVAKILTRRWKRC